MTIEDAIKHAEEVARNGCSDYSDEHRQLADWLLELVKLRKEKREKKYEYSVRYKNGELSCLRHTEPFKDEDVAAADCICVRRAVGEWEVM